MFRSLFCLLLFISYGLSSQRLGDIESSFGTEGRVIDNLISTQFEGFTALQEQSTKQLVVLSNVLGQGGQEAVFARYRTNGTIDSGFGDRGTTRFYPGGTGFVGFQFALQEDDKILVSGQSQLRMYVARFTAQGMLDTSFADAGIWRDPTEDAVTAGDPLFVQPDGKILVAGYYLPNGSTLRQLYIARLLPNGALDTDFGDNGFTIIPDGNSSVGSRDVRVQFDGKILVCGTSRNNGVNVATVRLLPNGQPDPAFGEDGVVYTSITTSDDTGFSIQQLPDSSLLIGAKSISRRTTHPDFSLFKLRTNGQLDTLFGERGFVITDLPGSAAHLFRVIPLSNGKILAGGTARGGDDHNWALARYDANGDLDPTFGEGGIKIYDFDRDNEWMYDLVMSRDRQHLYGVGWTDNRTTNRDGMIIRFTGEEEPTNTTNTPNDNLPLTLFPNPTPGPIQFRIPTGLTIRAIDIYDATGRRVFQKSLTTDGALSLANQPPGLYLIKLSTNQGTVRRKLVLQ